MSVLEHLQIFLDTKGHNESNIHDKTKSAIVLLQTLPCATAAILEQIGEVFHEGAKKYISEVEKQMLSGQCGFLEINTPEVDILITDIKKILLGFIQCNHDTWAPLIARWSTDLLGSICSQYGILRALSNLQIDERLQLWMNCSACRVLMEISVTCFGYIIEDSPDVCVDYLLGTAAKSSPYFDWVISHMCCCFLDVIPYGILMHALVAFSMQAKNAEMVINCVTRVYNFLLNQHGKVLQNAVLDLFKDSVSAQSVEVGSHQEHIDKCTLPFLLHLALHVPRLVDQITEKVTDLLDMKTITALSQQSNKREVVLQRGLLSRVLDILKNVGKGTFKVLIFLIDSSCHSNDSLSQDDAKVYAERKRIASTLLEMLLLHMHDNVQNLLTRRRAQEENAEEAVLDIPFLKELQKHIRKLCCELLVSESELRSKLLIRVLSLMCLYGGAKLTSEAFVFLLMKAKSSFNLSHMLALQCELEVYNDKILEDSLSKFVNGLCSSGRKLTEDETTNALRNCLCIVQQEQSYTLEPDRLKVKDCLQTGWTTLTCLTIEEYQVACHSLKLLGYLSLPTHRSLPQIFNSCQHLVTAYFRFIRRIVNDPGNDELWEMTQLCERLLIKLVAQNNIIQNTAIRQIVETLLKEENVSLVTQMHIQEDEDSNMFPAEPKVQLLEKNNSPDVVSRIPVKKSSVIYIGSLNKNKRKLADEVDSENYVKIGMIQQLLLNTIDSLLSVKSTVNEKMGDKSSYHFGNSFFEAFVQRLQESSNKPPYSFLANLLAEIICPDVTPTLIWPDEDFLKYTIERDIKIKKQFDFNPFLWSLFNLLSKERPALCYCAVIVQSLLATCLAYWEVDRKSTVKASPSQLDSTRKVLLLMKQAGWLPEPWCSSADFIEHLKPEDAYHLLSGLWRFCKDLNVSPQRFTDKHGIKPMIVFSNDQLDFLRRLFRDIFLRNMASLGVYYKQFFHPG